MQVTANVTLTYVDYDMGDGNTKRCRPTGLRYYLQAGRKPSPDCSYTYEKMSPREGKGTYRITSTRDIRVGEIQILNVPTH